MKLTLLDWFAIFAYLAASMLIGLYFRRRASQSTDDYFVSGRSASWWLAGTSMVATTFAADTPLAVTGIVYFNGIAGNWLWWSFLPSGMMTVFLFARLWRRSGLLTDVQFAEMRYAGHPAAFLRGFRAIYLGLLMNCIILGWVTKAMASILRVTLGVTDAQALAICIFFLIPFTGVYASLGGLWGVLWTDLFQFVLMMGIVVAVGWYAVDAAGGMDSLLHRLQQMRGAAGAHSIGDPAAFLPDFGAALSQEMIWTLPTLTFLVHLALQWWAFWYPGAEPGGGGYIAQRIFSTRSERDGLLSVLWFNLAHYAVRPWPWILTGLACLVLYPGLKGGDAEASYIRLATEHLPPAFLGILIAGFLAAFMSTVATQLNWGASYIVGDFYRRFWRPAEPEPHYVNVSRLVVTPLLVVAAGGIAWVLTTITSGWQFVLEVGAGTGAVYILRWYWWRINAWSEISAMFTALVVSLYLRYAQPFADAGPVLFAKSALTTTLITTLVWVVVTFVTPPEPLPKLLDFYRRVRPHAAGWGPLAAQCPDVPPTRDLGANLWAWLLGCVMVYSVLFGTGKLLLKQPALGAALLALGLVSGALLYRDIMRRVTA
jgi:Na+/proline symporter